MCGLRRRLICRIARRTRSGIIIPASPLYWFLPGENRSSRSKFNLSPFFRTRFRFQCNPPKSSGMETLAINTTFAPRNSNFSFVQSKVVFETFKSNDKSKLNIYVFQSKIFPVNLSPWVQPTQSPNTDAILSTLSIPNISYSFLKRKKHFSKGKNRFSKGKKRFSKGKNVFQREKNVFQKEKTFFKRKNRFSKGKNAF